jgi:hypothetical protein
MTASIIFPKGGKLSGAPVRRVYVRGSPLGDRDGRLDVAPGDPRGGSVRSLILLTTNQATAWFLSGQRLRETDDVPA